MGVILKGGQKSRKPHPLQREEGSCHAATMDLLPLPKLAVTNEIHAVRRMHPLSWIAITSHV